MSDLFETVRMVRNLGMPPDEQGNYVCVVNSSWLAGLRREAVRHDWYHRRHVERWERRYRKPYPEPAAEVGVWIGMKFLE